MTALPTFPLAPAEKRLKSTGRRQLMTFKLPVALRSESFTEIHRLSLGCATTSEQRRLPIDEQQHMQVAVIISESKRFDYTQAFSFDCTYLA